MAISDEEMQQMMLQTREYTVVLLHQGPAYTDEGSRAIVWEHGRRNFELRAAGQLAVVCPVTDDSDLCGVGIFDGDLDQTRAVMADDPGVKAGVFTYEVHPVRSFPGDALP